MSKLRLNWYNLVLLGLSWGVMAMPSASYAIAAKPAMSQENKINNSPKIPNIASLPASKRISTKAIDLLSPVELPQYFTDIQTRNYKLGQLNLEQFCQDFPYNSKCRGTTPGVESPSSIPVPVPPPAPPAPSTPSEDNSSSGSGDGQKTGWAFVPEISTLGVGGHVVRKLIPQINARVGLNLFGLNADVDSEDVEYDGDLDLLNISTIIDIHPSKNSGFKISGGAIFTNNKIEGTATTEDTIIIGDEEFESNVVESTDVDIEITRNVAPYLGIGWGNAVAANKGFGFWFNLGVMFGGSPDIEVTPNFGEDATEEQKNQANEAVKEEEKEIEDNLAFISIYPVASLGISYQF